MRRIEDGREGAMDALMDSVYTNLQRMAERFLDQHFGAGLPGVTLEPAALVHESYLRLIKRRRRFDDRGHFFAIATKVMLRVLVDYERRRRAAKRGGDRRRITLLLDQPASSQIPSEASGIEVEELARALLRLEQHDRRKADVVKLRVVWGLTMPEVAESLRVSVPTLERDWAFAKAWLLREVGGGPD